MMIEAQSDLQIRPGRAEDAIACADILNDWIDDRPWMPRIHSREDVRAFYRDFVFQHRQVWVAGEPIEGFLAMDRSGGAVTALYVARAGRGVGKALLDHAKAGRNALELHTFQANTGARRFYAREGFSEIRFTDGDNEEGLPDVLLRWERGVG